jgi:hypothetical protein
MKSMSENQSKTSRPSRAEHGSMIPIWRAATIKAWHSRKLMRAAQTPELQQRKAA